MPHPATPNHPGLFIRKSVIPEKLSVTDAAKLLGVGRPALSNLLNGKSALSTEMALRLEKTFGSDSNQLLKIQAEFERHDTKAQNDPLVKMYVPPFLLIKARQIQDWATDNIQARSLLAILLRKLIHSTGSNLTVVDFPGYDNSERKGWDGRTETVATNPWIPAGFSGWEFGCTKAPRKKAEGDYKSRTSEVPLEERLEMNFVFVTPFNWKEKDIWANGKKKLNEWKSVRALDASDLEQWLEQSIPAQAWFAEYLNLPQEGVRTLEQHWNDWSSVTEPILIKEIFNSSIDTHKRKFDSWINSAPTFPYVVTSDSKGEALAFLSCLIPNTNVRGASDLDNTLVFHSIETLRKLSNSSISFIQIVFTDDLEKEVASSYKKRHTIIVRIRNFSEKNPNISLDLLNYQDFSEALTKMGFDHNRINSLARESGNSPTILRRRLSCVDAIKFPEWSKDKAVIRDLIPFVLVGAWNTEFNADCEILQTVSNAEQYNSIEQSLAEMLKFDESPVWSSGKFRGVVSKIDAFFAVHRSITSKDLTDFFFAAEYVLSEIDPALDLPEDQRWAAILYKKMRNHSSALREGLCETLVILSVHGNNLFQQRLGIDVGSRVETLIEKLLSPITEEKLLSYQKDLTLFAEAAPKAFLKIIEEDLKQASPHVFELMKPASKSGIFGSTNRSELLWALETLAWNPNNLVRVSIILARLAEINIDDNWVNKPDNSFKAIYRAWMPQTASSSQERNSVLEKILKDFPNVGWKICIDQFEARDRIGHYSHRPRWRNDASGFGQPVSWSKAKETIEKAIDLAISFPSHTENTLTDLVERIESLPADRQSKVWDLIMSWAKTETNEDKKVTLRKNIRRLIFNLRGWKTLDDNTRIRAQFAVESLNPKDIVINYKWLFESQWVHDLYEEDEENLGDYRKRDEKIIKLRNDALSEIWKVEGLSGISRLLAASGAPYSIGWHIENAKIDIGERENFILQCFEKFGDELSFKCEDLIRGFVRAQKVEILKTIVEGIIPKLTYEFKIKFLLCCPFDPETWKVVQSLGQDIAKEYWHKVVPWWGGFESPQTEELIDRLFEVGRPRAAFSAVHLDWSKVETGRLKRLLKEVVTNRNEPSNTYQLSSYDISTALKALQERKVSEEEMADLEFLFIRVLGDTDHGIPNLERQLSKSPNLFAHLVAIIYKRKDGQEDPPELNFGDENNQQALFGVAYTLLSKIKFIPGTDTQGTINANELRVWVNDVRQLCSKYGRVNMGDLTIGQLLGKAPIGIDGIWPCEPVREVLEEILTPDIGSGIDMGINNSGGARLRAAGGSEEREKSLKYNTWAKQLAVDYPSVSKLLEQVADGFDQFATLEKSRDDIRQRLWH